MEDAEDWSISTSCSHLHAGEILFFVAIRQLEGSPIEANDGKERKDVTLRQG